MRKAFLGLTCHMGRLLYRILPPAFSSRLAASPFGQLVGRHIAPSEDRVYECDFGIRLLLSGEDARTSGIAFMGRTNPLETELLVRFLEPGQTMVEIGTYKDGWLALVGAKRVGAAGRVVCYEPMPEHCRRFRENVALNQASNIQVEEAAVSNCNGQAVFSMDGTGSSLVVDRAGKRDFTVRTVRLDDSLRALGVGRVDFLVIDAEGAESMVIEGGRETIAGATFLLVEVVDEFCRHGGTTADELVQSIAGFGFSPHLITRGGLRPWAPGRQSETLNMFFIRRGHVPA